MVSFLQRQQRKGTRDGMRSRLNNLWKKASHRTQRKFPLKDEAHGELADSEIKSQIPYQQRSVDCDATARTIGLSFGTGDSLDSFKSTKRAVCQSHTSPGRNSFGLATIPEPLSPESSAIEKNEHQLLPWNSPFLVESVDGEDTVSMNHSKERLLQTVGTSNDEEMEISFESAPSSPFFKPIPLAAEKKGASAFERHRASRTSLKMVGEVHVDEQSEDSLGLVDPSSHQPLAWDRPRPQRFDGRPMREVRIPIGVAKGRTSGRNEVNNVYAPSLNDRTDFKNEFDGQGDVRDQIFDSLFERGAHEVSRSGSAIRKRTPSHRSRKPRIFNEADGLTRRARSEYLTTGSYCDVREVATQAKPIVCDEFVPFSSMPSRTQTAPVEKCSTWGSLVIDKKKDEDVEKWVNELYSEQHWSKSLLYEPELKYDHDISYRGHGEAKYEEEGDSLVEFLDEDDEDNILNVKRKGHIKTKARGRMYILEEDKEGGTKLSLRSNSTLGLRQEYIKSSSPYCVSPASVTLDDETQDESRAGTGLFCSAFDFRANGLFLGFMDGERQSLRGRSSHGDRVQMNPIRSDLLGQTKDKALLEFQELTRRGSSAIKRLFAKDG